MTTADLQSVNALLGASKKTAPLPADDIRAEFDLVVVHASSLAAQPHVAALAAHADAVLLVAREADDVGAAVAALSQFGTAPIGLVLNRAFTERRGEVRAMAS
jgi:Mrp family chromosome partitioning ATPase